LPIDRILVETDSPYLAPGPFRGKQNTPAKVVYVAQQIADLKNLSYDFVVESTTNDFLHLFDNELRRNFLVINLLFFFDFCYLHGAQLMFYAS
jgi:TatD DNase family protein